MRADGGIRTHNLLITNQLHCQLCYVGIMNMAIGIEPIFPTEMWVFLPLNYTIFYPINNYFCP